MRGEDTRARTAAAPSVASSGKQWVLRRGRQLLKVLGALAAGLVLLLAAALLQRATCLIGLPDVGDPFDVAAYESSRPSDDRNAFAFYRRAMEMRGPRPALPRGSLDAIPTRSWSESEPELRGWTESNRETLAVFLEGSRRTEAWARTSDGESTFHHESFYMEPMVQLALLDAARLEEGGDRGEAWERLRAVLAMHTHLMRGGSASERRVANLDCRAMPSRVAAWASDPRTTVGLLRKALDDTRDLEPRPEWAASSLKVEYLMALRELHRPDSPLARASSPYDDYKILGESLPPDLVDRAYAIRRFLLREPERTRRTLRLTFANWLGHFGSTERGRSKPVVRVRLEETSQEPGLWLYAPEPSSEPLIDPKALAEWMLTAPDLRLVKNWWNWIGLGIEEQRQHREILVTLASELFLREKGRPIENEEDLVGVYLERLPEASSELDDLVLTVEEISPTSSSAAKPGNPPARE